MKPFYRDLPVQAVESLIKFEDEEATHGGEASPTFKEIAKTPVGPQQPSLQFDSVFESGNLAVALRISENEYDLVL